MKKRYVLIITAVLGLFLVISISVMLYAFALQIKAQAELDKVQRLYEKCKSESN